jgi:aminoglycoside phosphotransferase (APT) family kinase protein
MDLVQVRQHIPAMRHATDVRPIHRGFSADGKYFLYESGGDRPAYVLRTAALRHTERKRGEFDIIRRVYETGVLTSEPILFGTIEPMDICYMILRYVEGEDAADVLPALTSDEQYLIGEQAGRELRHMHEIEAPADLPPWHIHRAAKHNRQYADYRGCGVKLSEEAAIIAFIDEHSALMTDRPNRFQHDDFHPSNLLVHNRRYAGAIDYNRYDWGDPYHDFLKVAYFGREASVPFSIGQIYGYFDGQVPDSFWKLYALYTALIVFPSVTWTLQVVPEQLDSMLERIGVVLEDHRGFRSVVPVWYRP